MSNTFKINLIDLDGNRQTVSCDEDQYILDAIEEADIEVLYSCKAGACSTCVVKVTSGEVDQTDQSFLDDGQIENGYAMACVAYPQSDVDIIMGVEEELF